MAANWLVPEPLPAVSRRTAARFTFGAICLSSSNHFPPILNSKFHEPGDVAAWSRQAVYVAGAYPDRRSIGNTIGTVRETCSNAATGPGAMGERARLARARPIRLRAGEYRRHWSSRPASVDPHIAADSSSLTRSQSLLERTRGGPDMPHRPRLRPGALRCAASPLPRAHRKRPRRRAAEQADEVAPSHSITSSAMASTPGGMTRPSALAVLRLMTSSKFAQLHDRQIARLLALEDLSVV